MKTGASGQPRHRCALPWASVGGEIGPTGPTILTIQSRARHRPVASLRPGRRGCLWAALLVSVLGQACGGAEGGEKGSASSGAPDAQAEAFDLNLVDATASAGDVQAPGEVLGADGGALDVVAVVDAAAVNDVGAGDVAASTDQAAVDAWTGADDALNAPETADAPSPMDAGDVGPEDSAPDAPPDGAQPDAGADAATGNDGAGNADGGPAGTGADASADALATGDAAAGPDAVWAPWGNDAWSGPVVVQDPANMPKAPFVDVTASYPLDHKGLWAPCAAVGYVDGDDYPDAVFIEIKPKFGDLPDVFIRVLRTGPKMTVVTSTLDSSLLHPNGGCALADFSGDGFDDLLVGGPAGLAYYLGDGKGGFKDISLTHLPAILQTRVWGIGVDDFNGDGRLDAYLGGGGPPVPPSGGPGSGPPPEGGLPCKTCKYTKDDFMCPFNTPAALDPYNDDRMLVQDASGKLVDVTAQWAPLKDGHLTEVASWDFDGDGFPEALVGDDFGLHKLLPNLGGKKFGAPLADGFMNWGQAMGWGIGDLNDDGAVDVVLADAGPIHIYAGKPGSPLGPFAVQPPGHPVTGATWESNSWTPQLADFDHDGDLDMYLGVTLWAVGKMVQVSTGCMSNPSPFPANDLYFRNDGGFNFEVSTVAKGDCGGIAPLAQSLIDFDLDGDLDVVQVRTDCDFDNARLRFLRNDLPKAGGSITVRLIGPKGNADAIGARLLTTVGGKALERRIVGATSVGSSGDRFIHLGMGKNGNTGVVTVKWPGGKTSQYGALQVGAKVTWKAP